MCSASRKHLQRFCIRSDHCGSSQYHVPEICRKFRINRVLKIFFALYLLRLLRIWNKSIKYQIAQRSNIRCFQGWLCLCTAWYGLFELYLHTWCAPILLLADSTGYNTSVDGTVIELENLLILYCQASVCYFNLGCATFESRSLQRNKYSTQFDYRGQYENHTWMRIKTLLEFKRTLC